MQSHLVGPLFFSENVFALTWILLAYNLWHNIDPDYKKSILYFMAPVITIFIGLLMGGFWALGKPAFGITDNKLIFLHYGQLFFSSLFLLVAVLVNAWRLEAFWRTVDSKVRKQYKYLVMGFFLISGSLGWSASFRLTYLHLKGDHLLLLSILLITAWCYIAYALAGSRLLNRKIFVSRKIVYSSVAPFVFAIYLISMGLISLLMRTFGWSMNFIFQWVLIIAGLLLIAAFVFSDRIRARVKYFISTHFYVNKYEYRDEWLTFSDLLHRRLTESGVVEALRHILHDSLYTDIIKIWLGDVKTGFRLIGTQYSQYDTAKAIISPDDPLVSCLQNVPYLDCRTPVFSSEQKCFLSEKKDFFTSLELVLLVPLAIGKHFVGIIGLGAEYTGGKYGRDDFDLLSALASQAASALLAVRTAEELARSREQNAWNTLSAFVLHDIKNAANILSLVKENAPAHIHDPEFQQDMLVSVADALKRMTKVQSRLKTLEGEIVPKIKALDAVELLRSCCKDLGKKLPELKIEMQCQYDHFQISTDPEFFFSILENLFLNSLEAGGRGTRVQITILKAQETEFQMEVSDNGPGISPDLLPHRLFEPFKTTRPKGSGIGLWQVRQLVESLGGKIEAENIESQGARFVIRLPSGLMKN
jgi:putative PEP-CTERM system histidine kinase